jgi:hypothetical protein
VGQFEGEDISKRFDIRRQISELTGIPYPTVVSHTSESTYNGASEQVAVPKQVAEPIQEAQL